MNHESNNDEEDRAALHNVLRQFGGASSEIKSNEEEKVIEEMQEVYSQNVQGQVSSHVSGHSVETGSNDDLHDIHFKSSPCKNEELIEYK